MDRPIDARLPSTPADCHVRVGSPALAADWLALARVLHRIAARHERQILRRDELEAIVAKGSAA